jgi:hypothetical protein
MKYLFSFIITFIIFIIYILLLILNKKEGFEQKCLIVLYGESFREGQQYSRVRDTSNSYVTQMSASDSHLKFMDMLKYKYNIDSDVSISTYNTKYENELKEKYKGKQLFFNSEENLIGYINIAKKGLENIDLKNYKFILFTRNDIYLKDEFIKNFKEYDKITYISQHTITHDCYLNGTPVVNPTIIYVPHKYFKIINDIEVGHNSWKLLYDMHGLNKNDLGFMLDTYHDADSYKGWNPYYKMVQRNETDVWLDKDTPNIYKNNLCYDAHDD